MTKDGHTRKEEDLLIIGKSGPLEVRILVPDPNFSLTFSSGKKFKMDTADFNLTFSNITLDYFNQSYFKPNRTYLRHNPYYAKISKNLSITLYCLIFVLGTIGNGLVIWITRFRSKRTINAVWFLNLAIADFLCCAFLPLRITEWIRLPMNSKLAFCSVNSIQFNLNMSTSVLILTVMSIDRCASVIWPIWVKIHKTRKRVRLTVAIIWVLSFLLTGLVFYLFRFYFFDISEWCQLHSAKTDMFKKIKYIIRLIRLVIMFVISFLIIFSSYVPIFLRLKKRKRSQRSERSYRIIIAVILCFFICWFPYYIWPLVSPYDGRYTEYFTINIITTNLACLNSCINPFIYVFVGKDFQQGFLRSIPSRIQRALNEPNLCSDQEGVDDTLSTKV
ncbi:N-formyl peptide receptor 3-like [Phyllobates terribilis]|uniref:N-formyl peptide receptor 3-like n=1 Tax=Phyllobates terribilis TaxID=111132 RepID=UPI003CCB30DF